MTMSFTDPLIKELKGHTLKLTQELKNEGEITDRSNDVLPLCNVIERIFQKGCIRHSWNVLDELAHLMDMGHILQKSYTYLRVIEMVRKCQKVKSAKGKFRLLMRSCLVNKCLHVPVEIMVRTYRKLTWNWYDLEASILGNEILGEIFLSVLLQCSTLHFKLDLDNSRFLDTTLILPQYDIIEFVPSASLGIAITFIDDKALVVQVDEKSVAAEDNQIQVGDILDELNGHVLHAELRGKLNAIMTKGRNKPIIVRLVKSRNPKNGCIYGPIQSLLSRANVDISEMENTQEEKLDKEEKIFRKNNRIGNEVNYIGSREVGEAGHVKLIEHVISEFVKNPNKSKFIKARIECHELGLKVFKELTGEMLTSNTFMEISSCGQTKNHPKYFGYIAGDNLCNVASKFTCHVFQTNYVSDIQNILQNIGEGFQRTHFAV